MEEIYQQFIIELYKNPLNFGKLENPTFTAILHNTTCGDKIEIFLKTENGKGSGKIINVKYVGTGCAISQASASLFTNFLKGKRISDIKSGKINKDSVLSLLKVDLSKNPSRMKCALLVLDAVKNAVQ